MDKPDAILDMGALAELEQDLGEAFTPFVHRFLAATAGDLEAVQGALRAGDCASAAARAHSAKGTAGYLGAGALVTCLGALQHAAQRGDHARAGELTTIASRLLDEVAPLLRARAGGD
jgi:HPt (histidine-containing phosphotransfer) domain-containing protein